MRSSLLVLILCFAFFAANAQGQAVNPPKQEALKFVQGFYDWYMAKNKVAEGKAVAATPFELAIRDKRPLFDPALLNLLKEDIEASAKSPGEIVGLSFDPFLNTQDPKEQYVVGNAASQGETWRVEVLGVRGGRKDTNPAVIAELARREGRWVFANFHYEKSVYPENENLMGLLRALKKSREKTP